jgi:hypothetical protein
MQMQNQNTKTQKERHALHRLNLGLGLFDGYLLGSHSHHHLEPVAGRDDRV